MILFFDTETTGLPDYRAPSDAPQQPHLAQIALLLQDEGGNDRGVVSMVIRPDGWTIPDDVAAIHGITQARALAEGIPESLAALLYKTYVEQCSIRVAHNESFDRRIMRIAMLRSGVTREEIEALEKRPHFCTCLAATPIVDLPPTEKMRAAGFKKPKAPKLEECIKHFFGEGLSGAHDALVDVRACARVYFYLQSLKGGLAA